MLWILCYTPVLFSLTIAEKKESFGKSEVLLNKEVEEKLCLLNETLAEKKELLLHLYQKAYEQKCRSFDTDCLKEIHEQICILKKEIEEIEVLWRKDIVANVPGDNYGLWNQSDMTLNQLVAEFGSHEYLYIMPPDIALIRLTLNSNLPVPRESWSECLEIVLQYYGIGVRQTHPFIRELYFLNRDLSGFSTMIYSFDEADLLNDHERVCYVLEPEQTNLKRSWGFLNKFVNPLTTSIHLIDHKFFIIGPVSSLKELVKLYQFADFEKESFDHQFISSSRFSAEEMTALLHAVLDQTHVDSPDQMKLTVVQALKDSIFITGPKNDVTYAVNLIKDLEAQVKEPQKKTVYWYTTKHSEAKELAVTLSNIYALLKDMPAIELSAQSTADLIESAHDTNPVETPMVEPGAFQSKESFVKNTSNFIVDEKTGCIIMVVEESLLPKIKEVIQKLDIPKKMVQIEVLLFEKKLSHHSKFGLNLLKLGSEATKTAYTGSTFNAVGRGVLEFLIGKPRESGVPAFDLAYQFLLGQEDIQINAAPSITTVNQTPAKIAIVEEISINTGAVLDKKQSTQSYARAQYGITLQITPTVNQAEEDQEISYITLDTDITFDSTSKEKMDRPDVTRRNIKNHVRIADGQTVVLGGLRRKTSENKKDSLPFLGDLPGIGKLFSSTESTSGSSEMFIFITPKIITDPAEQKEIALKQNLKKRPGDYPLLLQEINDSKAVQKQRLFEGTLKTLFSSHDKQNFEYPKEYDGRAS